MPRRLLISLEILLAATIVAYFAYSGRVLLQATGPLLTAVSHLEKGEGLVVKDPNAASKEFEAASTTIYDTVKDLQQSSTSTQVLSVLPPFRWQVRLMKASYALAQAGTLTSQLAAKAPSLPKGQKDVNVLLTTTDTAYSQWYHANQPTVTEIQRQIETANTEMDAVPPWIAMHHYRQLKHAKELVAEASGSLRTAQKVISEMEVVMGSQDKKTHTFMVVFQNDSELRTTGGFPGSYTLLTTQNGVIKGYRFGTNIYKIDKAFYARTVIRPPEPLQTITPYLAFRDSNVTGGFLSTTAPEMAEMYAKETGTKVEGMIFMDASVLVDIMRVTGPLNLPATSTQTNVTADTVRNAITTEVEKNYFTDEANKQVNEPKQVLNDLIPVLLAKLQWTEGGFSKLGPVLKQATQRKSIQIWLPNSQSATTLALFPQDKPLPDSNWLKVVNNNIGGMKSSLSVEQTVRLEQKADPIQKKLVSTLTITRRHTGNGVWPDGDNRNYTEVFLPKAASVTQIPYGQGGFSSLTSEQQAQLKVTDKNWNKPVQDSGTDYQRVGFWLSTAVGKQSVATLTYTLPLTEAYQDRFTYIKQAGAGKETLQLPAFKYKKPVFANIALVK